MSQYARITIVLVVVAVALALPGEAQANGGGGGLWDWIHKLSGPEVRGFGLFAETCISRLLTGSESCSDSGRNMTAASGTFDAYLRGSVSLTSGEQQVGDEFLGVDRWAISPTVVFIYQTGAAVKPIGSVGYIYNRITGNSFENFTRHAAELTGGVRFTFGDRPIYLDVAGRLIYFPTSVTREDFGGEPDPEQGGGEWSKGALLMFGVRF